MKRRTKTSGAGMQEMQRQTTERTHKSKKQYSRKSKHQVDWDDDDYYPDRSF